ncbi:hypothetical protein [Clostridium cibarium]|uniref:Uncharacterized protein n=1 Tax=Clostridium cibarium TaxID=2762247 RepID=A0ABR8PV84_9CLOT|nr:hypothetical protein [Clostridium cibarium]MBD7912095.1 hypothetical protein [Clostridium cibarium]
MEQWEEVYKNTIPVGEYQALVKNGEESGLFIKLECNEYIANINFGIVSAFRMFDEGIVLAGIFDENEITKYKKSNFSNTIYKIKDGEFGNFIKKTSNEIYDYLGLSHFVIITINYVIEVISEWEPSIEISKK